jgi:aminopeptidase-like protein
VLACVGDAGAPTYKRSRQHAAEIDRAVEHVLSSRGTPYAIRPFSPYGYDERQYCSPGIDLPIGCLMRTPHGEFPEYHTSADDLSLVKPDALADSLDVCLAVTDVLEGNKCYVNLSPKGEPQLGRRGLYQQAAAHSGAADQMSLLWVLNLSDGTHRLLDIAERAVLPFGAIKRAADALESAGLLQSAQ